MTPVAPEIEAKLAVPRPATLRALARLPQIGSFPLRPIARERLHSIYLDTRDLVLARHRIALRVRRSARRWEATIKWSGSSSGEIHTRPELNVALEGEPDLARLGAHEILHPHLAALLAGRRLAPLFVTDVTRRRIALLSGNGNGEPALAEVDLDEVEVRRTPGETAAARYCEVEIETVAGSVEDLRRATLILKQDFNLLGSTASKFSRGLTLFHPRLEPQPESVALAASDDAESALRKILATQLQRLRGRDPQARAGSDPEAVHDMRVAIRRMRAALRTFPQGLPHDSVEHLGSELKWLGEVLGQVRDLDVQMARFADFGQRAPAGMRASLEDLHRYLAMQSEKERMAMLAVLSSRRYFRLLRALERFAARRRRARGETPALPQLGAAAVRHAYKRLRKRAKGAAVPDSETMHALRIRAKRLRYTLEFFRPLAGKSARQAVNDLTEVQEVLGTYHDAIVAAETARRYSETLETAVGAARLLTLGALIGAELQQAEAMRQQFAKAWRQLSKGKGREHIRRTIDRLAKLAPHEAERARQAPSGAAEAG